MRIVCVYTPEFQASTEAAKQCVESGKRFGYEVELYRSVYFKRMDRIHKYYGLKKRYKPSLNAALTKTTCPATRMANGTTHYLLYLECISSGEPLCILEHDAEIVGKLPEAREGVIQVSSGQPRQLGREDWENCSRARRMAVHEPDRAVYWTDKTGVVKHPLSGMNGTSGYIISPCAAQKMARYVKESGVAFADRVRAEHIGDCLWLQKPQSVLAHHDRVKSHEWARR